MDNLTDKNKLPIEQFDEELYRHDEVECERCSCLMNKDDSEFIPTPDGPDDFTNILVCKECFDYLDSMPMEVDDE